MDRFYGPGARRCREGPMRVRSRRPDVSVARGSRELECPRLPRSRPDNRLVQRRGGDSNPDGPKGPYRFSRPARPPPKAFETRGFGKGGTKKGTAGARSLVLVPRQTAVKKLPRALDVLG